MPLVTTTEMLKKAYAGGYAVGAFNVNNMEIIQGITEAAQEFTEKINRYGGKIDDAVGIPEDMLFQAARSAVCKTNIDSDIRMAMTAAIREHLWQNPDHFDPRQYLAPARQAVKDMVSHKIHHVLGCEGKA